MRIYKSKHAIFWLIAITFPFLVIPSLTLGQSRTSSVSVGAGNFENSNIFTTFGRGFDPDGGFVEASGSTTFTGLDSNGNIQTMSYSGDGMASADYGLLRTQASGSVSNIYYNPDNPPLVEPGDSINPDGSPSNIQVSAQAVATDTLQFGGSLQAGYQARYQFRLTGVISDPSAFFTMGVTIAGNSERYFSPDDFVGNLLEFYGTQSYPVNGSTPQEVRIQVLSSFAPGISSRPEGSSASGEADFFNTIVLERIEMLDADGNLVPPTEWTVTAASGTNYPVPEPSGLALLLSLIPALVIVRRM